MLTAFFLSAAEGMSEDFYAKQTLSMFRFIAKAPTPGYNFCDFFEVRCDDQRIVREISIDAHSTFTHAFYIEWLPRTVRKMLFVNRALNQQLETRKLPQELEECTINECAKLRLVYQ